MSVSIRPNPDFELAVQYVFYTDRSVFLTGKAGTGKTTFLRYVREHCTKKMAIAAPTGVAAINAGGITLHSLFQLPFGTYIADYPNSWGGTQEINNYHTLTSGLRLNHNKRQLIQELELLIIDEVSMLRCDMLDAIDAVLRLVRGKDNIPFGGVQLLFIGDLYQLPPVVSREEWALLSAYYSSPFFFDARVLQQCPLLTIELQTIYRQQDTEFIELLNNIRNNTADSSDLRFLDQQYDPDFAPDVHSGYILLTTHNAKADVVNKSELEKLAGPVYHFDGELKGDFSERIVPVEKRMALKEGAQVMFVKNDKGENRRYYNGKIVTVSRIQMGKIFVDLGQGNELELERETWRNVNFTYNKDKDEVEEEELGSFTQYPIRLAWAITIHKSQGLTFERAIVDAGASFAPGQVYVALSRLTSLEGLVLRTRIQAAQVMTDERVVHYAKNSSSNDQLKRMLAFEQRTFAANKLLESFNFSKLSEAFNDHYLSFARSGIPEKEEALSLAVQWKNQMTDLNEVAQKFARQLQHIFSQPTTPDYGQIHERTKAAINYFFGFIVPLEQLLKGHIDHYKVKQKTKKFITQLKYLQHLLWRRKLILEQAGEIASGLSSGVDMSSLLSLIEADRKKVIGQEQTEEEVAKQKTVGNSKQITLSMYREGHSLDSIAEARSMAKTTIEGHLVFYIGTGELSVSVLVGSEDLSLILKAIHHGKTTSAAQLKEQLPDYITYSQIRAAVAYHQFTNQSG